MLPVPPSLSWAPANSYLHRRPSNTSRYFWLVSCGATAHFLCVLMHTKFCLCPPRLESLFLPVLWKCFNQILMAFNVRFPGYSQSLCKIPRMGSLALGLEPQQLHKLFGIIVLQFVSNPLCGYMIWFYLDCAPSTISLSLVLCLWMWDIFFLVFSSILLFNSCGFDVLTGGVELLLWSTPQEMCFYSDILNHKPRYFLRAKITER